MQRPNMIASLIIGLLVGCGPALEDQRAASGEDVKSQEQSSATNQGLRLSAPDDIEIETSSYNPEVWEEYIKDGHKTGDLNVHCGNEEIPVVIAEFDDDDFENLVENQYTWQLTVKHYGTRYSQEEYSKLKDEYVQIKDKLAGLKEYFDNNEEDGDDREKLKKRYKELKARLSTVRDLMENLTLNDGQGHSRTYYFPAQCKEPVIQIAGMDKGGKYTLHASFLEDGCALYAGRTKRFNYDGRTLDVKLPMDQVDSCNPGEGVVNVHVVY